MGTYTSQEDELFFAALGRLTVSWGHLELGLDSAIYTIYHAIPLADREPEIPRSLSRKLTFLKKAIKRLPISETDMPRYLEFFETIRTESDTRHDLIHGAVASHEEGSGEATFVRLLHKKTTWDRKQVDVSTAIILQAAVRAQRLASKTLEFAGAVNQTFP